MMAVTVDVTATSYDKYDPGFGIYDDGFTNENRFDQVFAASMIGGPSEKFESNPPVSNRYVTCGKHPFISFYYTIEGLSLPVFTEVKQAAGKVTGALFNIAKSLSTLVFNIY